MALFVFPPVTLSISGNATEAKQDVQITEAQSTNTKLDTANSSLTSLAAEDFSTETTLAALSAKVTAVDTTGKATEAKQDSQITEAQSTNTKLDTANSSLTSIAAEDFSTETTLSAFSAKTAAALVPEAFDYQAITYVGATTDINTVVYKTGGAGGTTVATLTMGYDGSNRLTSVTRS